MIYWLMYCWIGWCVWTCILGCTWIYIYIYWVCFACCVSCRLNWPVQANSAASFSSPHRAAVRLGLKTSHTDRCANRKFETMVKIQTVESALSRWSKVKRCQEALISCWCTARWRLWCFQWNHWKPTGGRSVKAVAHQRRCIWCE